MNEEYNTLRTEMLQKIDLHNKLIMFSITTTVTILAYAFSQNNPYLFLLPFCIIIPISFKIVYYRSAMVKITAYIIVFLEDEVSDINWETRNYWVNKMSNSKINIIQRKNINFENFTLSIVCYALFFVSLLRHNHFESLELLLINIIAPILFLIIEFFVAIKGTKLYRTKDYWINEWRKVKNFENQSL